MTAGWSGRRRRERINRSVVEIVLASLLKVPMVSNCKVSAGSGSDGDVLGVLRVKLDNNEVDAVRQVHLGAEAKVRGTRSSHW